MGLSVFPEQTYMQNEIPRRISVILRLGCFNTIKIIIPAVIRCLMSILLNTSFFSENKLPKSIMSASFVSSEG